MIALALFLATCFLAYANGANDNFKGVASLGKGFVLPLLLSPVLAILFGAILYFIMRSARLALGITKEWCVFVGCEERVVAQPKPASILAMQAALPAVSLTVDEMENCQGFSASLFGLPVSTTHVSVGSLFGIGVATGQANPRVMFNIVLSWIVTLPCAVLLGAGAYVLLRHL